MGTLEKKKHRILFSLMITVLLSEEKLRIIALDFLDLIVIY